MTSIAFVHPFALLLLVPGALLLAWLRRSPKGRGRRGGVSVALRGLVLFTLILAVSRPQSIREVERLAVAFVVDVSESVPTDRRDRALRRIEADLMARATEDDASLIVFAERPSVEIPFGLGPGAGGDAPLAVRLDQIESRVGRGASDLARAVEFAEGTFPSGAAKRIVLVSDGSETTGDLIAAARALAAAGVRLDVRPIAYRFDDEVIVEALHASERGRVGEPIQLRAVITSFVETDAEVALFDDGLLLGEPAAVKLSRGANVLRYSPIPDAAGYHAYEIEVRPVLDGQRANNVGRAGVIVGGTPRVLVVSSSAEHETLARTLAEAGIGIEVVEPSRLPRHPAGYVDVDSVVLVNVAAYDLDPLAANGLRDAVVELGVGVVTVGGDRAFGPGGYRGTPIEELVPVDLNTTHKKSMPKGALVIVLHSIEFDSGNTWAERICKSALEGLDADDEMGVVYYHHQKGERWLFDLAPIGDRDAQRTLIENVFVGDMPSFHNCFVLAAASLEASDAAVKHVVVISDGDPQAPDDALLTRMIQKRVTISSICIEPHGNSTATMERLAALGGGRYRQLFPRRGDLSKLPALMLKEATTLRRSAVKETPFVPIVALGRSALLRGIDGGVPSLLGYVVTSIKAGAETILLADEENADPLLAAGYAGIGRTVAFTSDASARWAKEWLGWSQYAPFWTQVIRSTIPDSNASLYPVRVETDGLVLTITLDARDEGNVPVTDLELDGILLGAGSEPVRFQPTQEEAGRYVARVEAAAPGHYLAQLRYERDGTAGRSLGVGAIDYAPEHRSLQSHEDRLARAAELTGGRVLRDGDEPFAHDFEAVVGRAELWAILVVIASLLVVLDVFARRFDFDLAPLVAALHRRRPRATRAKEVGSPDAPRSRDAPSLDVPPAAPDGSGTGPVPVAKTKPAAPDADTLDQLKKAKKRAAERREWK